MGWGNGWYRHSVRRKGRVTTEYYHGEDAILFAASFKLWREDREEAREEARALDERLRRRYEAERDTGRAIRGLLEVYLQASGYHRPARRRWRRRMSKTEIPALPTVKTAAAVHAEIGTLVKRIGQDRDLAALETLRRLVKEHPQVAQGAIVCELPREARKALAKHMFDFDGKPNDSRRDHLIAQMELTIADLAGDDPSPARRLCAEAVGFEWAMHWLLAIATSSKETFINEHPQTTRRRTASVKRLGYLLKTLAQIQALERPRQVVHATQINVSTDSPSTGGHIHE